MISIGIFDNTNYNYILKYLREIFNINLVNDFKVYNAFSTKNISNYYDILIIMSDINKSNREKIEHVIKKSKILIINNDDQELLDILSKSNLDNPYLLTYGFNLKSTMTISSIDELEQKVICVLQRQINDIYGNKIEPKEISVNKANTKFNNYKLLGIISLIMILGYLK